MLLAKIERDLAPCLPFHASVKKDHGGSKTFRVVKISVNGFHLFPASVTALAVPSQAFAHAPATGGTATSPTARITAVPLATLPVTALPFSVSTSQVPAPNSAGSAPAQATAAPFRVNVRLEPTTILFGNVFPRT